MAEKVVVGVKILRENGWYIGTSPDLEGLIVCHPNHTKFAQELPACIKALFMANHGMNVEVEELPSIHNPDISTVIFEATKKAA